MGGMNGRVVLLAVLNALVAVALAVLISVLVTRGDAPAGEGEIETPRGPQVRRSYPAQAPQELAARLKGDLMDREELIPFEGQLGGTMDFYEPESIHILSDRWVYAEFTDGHVQGGMLLEYTFEPGGEVSWRVLEARLE
ncbi:MAG: hypothetical protein GVY23_05465 [Spirochaetes bacterium]|jgi:hypothetical protein|nr:hypothetical protein [Spirochaetota bacterium]